MIRHVWYLASDAILSCLFSYMMQTVFKAGIENDIKIGYIACQNSLNCRHNYFLKEYLMEYVVENAGALIII